MYSRATTSLMADRPFFAACDFLSGLVDGLSFTILAVFMCYGVEEGR